MPVKTHVNHTADGNVIQRSNGATTFTEVMTKHLHKDYSTYRQDGLNEELMLDVLAQIEKTDILWDQGSWRQLVEAGLWPEEERKAVQESMAAFALDLEGQSLCGTAMCFAGWVSELADVDWVIDAKTVTEFRKVYGKQAHLDELSQWSEQLFIPVEEYEQYYAGRYNRIDDLDWYAEEVEPDSKAMAAFLARVAKARGFGPKTHSVIDVPSYAMDKLGIADDPLELFDGSNTLEEVQRRVAGYLRFGPKMPDCLIALVIDRSDTAIDVDKIDPDIHGTSEDRWCWSSRQVG